MSSRPDTHSPIRSTAPGEILGDGGYPASPRSPTPAAEPTAGSSTTTTTNAHAASAPALKTSSPGSRTGKSCGNADAATKPSTTASKSSPDSGTSKPADDYGSTPAPGASDKPASLNAATGSGYQRRHKG